MKITLLAVGSKMPRWVDEAFADYSKRFGRDIQFELKEIKPEKRGKNWTSVQLAGAMKDWMAGGDDICIVIGGADGLSQPLKARADIMLQLSAMTLPHGMVRVLLAEQLYRAY